MRLFEAKPVTTEEKERWMEGWIGRRKAGAEAGEFPAMSYEMRLLHRWSLVKDVPGGIRRPRLSAAPERHAEGTSAYRRHHTPGHVPLRTPNSSLNTPWHHLTHCPVSFMHCDYAN